MLSEFVLTVQSMTCAKWICVVRVCWVGNGKVQGDVVRRHEKAEEKDGVGQTVAEFAVRNAMSIEGHEAL